MTIPVTRVKPWSKDQGDFVEINTSDFDPDKFELYDSEEKAEKLTVPQLKEKLTAAGVEFKGNASKADLQALVDALPA